MSHPHPDPTPGPHPGQQSAGQASGDAPSSPETERIATTPGWTPGEQGPTQGQLPPGQQVPPPPPGGYPAPTMSPQDERTWGMVAHLVPAVLLPLSAGTGGFIASLVVYLVYKDRGPFVRAHAANSLNVQIITGVFLVIFGLLSAILIGIPFYIATIIVATIIHVVGAVKANNGEWWTPPLTPTMIR